jgi:hypothetical protein
MFPASITLETRTRDFAPLATNSATISFATANPPLSPMTSAVTVNRKKELVKTMQAVENGHPSLLQIRQHQDRLGATLIASLCHRTVSQPCGKHETARFTHLQRLLVTHWTRHPNLARMRPEMAKILNGD